MEHDEASDSCSTFTLTSGRRITLCTLVQRRTYAGLMEGVPNRVLNDQILQRNLDDARELTGSVGEPYLIPPPRRDYCDIPGDMQFVLDGQANRRRDNVRIPEWMPHVYLIGVFQSHSAARDKKKDTSILTVLWYQPDFGLDHAEVALIRQIDWDRFATDLEW